MCGCAWMPESVQGVSLLVYSLLNFLIKDFFPMPQSEDKHSYINTFCHSPADNWVCCLCWQEWERQIIWSEHDTRTRTHSNFNWKWRTFLLQCWELMHALQFCLTCPLFDLDKKGVREPPGGFLWVWRHFGILSALWATLEELLQRCIQRDCRADPVLKCCMQHLLGDWLAQCYFTQICILRPKWVVDLQVQVLQFAFVKTNMNCFISPLLSCQGCAPFL